MAGFGNGECQGSQFTFIIHASKADSTFYLHLYYSPNGKDCKYRHALPPGFVLKKKESEEERREREAREKSNQITIEDFLEKEVFVGSLLML